MNFRAIYKKGLDSVRLSGGKSAWGLEIGDSGLKAVKASARISLPDSLNLETGLVHLASILIYSCNYKLTTWSIEYIIRNI